jgi:glycosyltransferase involved in cell wall biosynthesis
MRLFVPNSPKASRSSLLILHVIGSLSPAAGGPPEAVRQLVAAQLQAGDGVEVVCLDNPADSFLIGIGCPVHALGESYLGSYEFSPRLWSWLSANAGRFDGIVVNGIWTFPGVAVRSAARRAKKPYAVFVHGALDPWFKRQYPLKHFKKLLYWPLQHAILHDALAVIFTSETERDLAKTSFSRSNWNSAVVPIGINDPEEGVREGEGGPSNPADQIEAFYCRLPVLRDRRYLLFLARIHEKKGCDLLVEAFAKIAASVPDVDLVIAGPDQGGMQAKLQRLAGRLGITGRLHWPGMIGGDLKWGALRASNAFVLPSHQENFGVAVVESLGVGRPVLISNQVNIWPEIVEDGVGLAEEDTLCGTERLLRNWFGLSPAEQEAMASGTRASFLERYALKRAVAGINRIFGPSGQGPATR